MLRGQCVEAAIHLARQLEGCNGEVCRRAAPMPVPNLSAPPTFLVNLYDQTATCCRAEQLIDMMINAPHINGAFWSGQTPIRAAYRQLCGAFGRSRDLRFRTEVRSTLRWSKRIRTRGPTVQDLPRC